LFNEKQVSKDLIIKVDKEQISIALLEDKVLVELHNDNLTHTFSVGNLYVGKIKRVMQGLNAAFVDIGCDKEGFIHYHDLGEQFNTYNTYVQQLLNDRKKLPKKIKQCPNLEKDGNISNVLTTGQYILVQIIKEPISTKGPRLTGEISFAGRNIVLLPFVENVFVSQKIKLKEERIRLRRLTQSIKPQNCGVIVRTVAEGKKGAELDNELKLLYKRWENSIAQIQKSKDITLVSEEMSRAVSIVRDIYSEDFENIYINDRSVFEEVSSYVKMIDPERGDIVKFYSDSLPIFDHFAITKQIKSSFGRVVSFKRGAYLILEQTEAMCVIDVNSGTRTRAAQTQEENALEVNMAAATEIARQVRLRDIGGLVVVDFIDMNEAANRQKLFEHMTAQMSNDRARHNILPLSKFCLMEMTRQRVRPAMSVDVLETCPTCFGTGKARPSILFTDQLEDKLDYLANELGMHRMTLRVHPYIAAYITKGFWSIIWQWRWKYKLVIKVVPMQEFGFLQFQFMNRHGEEVNIDQCTAVLE
jgi:ribonuclease G